MVAERRWPTAVDYRTAIQNPAVCFSDPALKEGCVATDALGLPVAATGNVAVVFRMTLKQREVMLRCFTHAHAPNLVRRYEELGIHLQGLHLPAFVACAYLPGEMVVNGQRYGIVQMERVGGLCLHRYIDRHVQEPAALQVLADRWRLLMAQLRTARIAHGDLSDGNILVDAKGRPFLVDYDAVYVPTLVDEPPDELGKPNFQHPARLNPEHPACGYYAENVDAFSALAIYLSLRALADDASFWDRYHRGDNLIFLQEDFEQPGGTLIWKELKGVRDAEVKALTDVLQSFCRGSVIDLPSLEDVLEGTAIRPLRSRTVMPPLDTPLATPRVATPAGDRSPQPGADRSPRPTVYQPAGQGAGSSLESLPGADEIVASVASRRHTYWIAGLGLAAALLLIVWMQRPGSDPAVESSRPSLARTVRAAAPSLATQDLIGFYTGYVSLIDGTRQPMALVIERPDTSLSLDSTYVAYSLNWKSFQRGGIGYYDAKAGRLHLDERYELNVAFTGADGVVLASQTRHEDGSVVRVNKTRTP